MKSFRWLLVFIALSLASGLAFDRSRNFLITPSDSPEVKVQTPDSSEAISVDSSIESVKQTKSSKYTNTAVNIEQVDTNQFQRDHYQSQKALPSRLDRAESKSPEPSSAKKHTSQNPKSKIPSSLDLVITANQFSEKSPVTKLDKPRAKIAKAHSRKESQPALKIAAAVPPGFDDLVGPQQALVDIYYEGEYLVSKLANYTQEWIEFEEPDGIINLIPNLERRQTLQNRIRQKLPTNADKVCYYPSQENCGVLSPEVLGVIFDEGQFRADLFVAPNLVQISQLPVDKYLPPSKTGLSLINAISMAATGGEQVEDSYNLQLNSVLGFQNYRLELDADYTNNNQAQIDNLSLIYDYQNLAFEIGSFRTNSQANSFFTQRDFLGARMQTSLSSRTDLEQLSGSGLFVFLFERSKIDVFKDGELIDSQYYDAGNIQLDTRSFPSGSYNVELVITGASGRQTRETQFFSKSLRLPPIGETLYFAEIGVPKIEESVGHRIPKGGSHAIVRGGLNSRVSQNFGWNASAIFNSDDVASEIGASFFFDRLYLQTGYSLSVNKGIGSYYQFDWDINSILLSGSYRKSSRESEVTFGNEYELISRDNRQIIFNASVPFEFSTANFIYRESERFGFVREKSYGASWRRNLYRTSGMQLDFSFDASKSNIESRVLLGLNLRFFNSNVNASLSTRGNISERDQQRSSHLDKRARLTVKNQIEKLGRFTNQIEYNDEANRQSYSYRGDVNNQHGYGRIELNQVKLTSSSSSQLSALTIGGSNVNGLNSNGQNTGDNSRFGYAANSRFNLIAKDGDIAVGGNRRELAGVLIDLSSIENDELTFSVLINGVSYPEISAGAKRFIALPAFKRYSVTLSPRGETLVDFDNRPKDLTLYPGNIERLSWEIKQVRVIVMQLTNAQGVPFNNARISDQSRYVRSDDLGWLQMRIAEPETLEFRNQLGERCKVAILQSEITENVNFLDKKVCD